MTSNDGEECDPIDYLLYVDDKVEECNKISFIESTISHSETSDEG